ncbi:hypothetical protein N9A30_01615 [Flavobacteriaceae bacterium]|nr:hypothetical protein [Flavobacteriaceae bacterium]
MKKLVFALCLFASFFINAQKSIGGKIYDKHPSIDVVDAFTKAFVAGDEATHWVSLSGTSNSDIISLYDILQNKYSKEMSELFNTRGEVIDVTDFRTTDLKRY